MHCSRRPCFGPGSGGVQPSRYAGAVRAAESAHRHFRVGQGVGGAEHRLCAGTYTLAAHHGRDGAIHIAPDSSGGEQLDGAILERRRCLVPSEPARRRQLVSADEAGAARSCSTCAASASSEDRSSAVARRASVASPAADRGRCGIHRRGCACHPSIQLNHLEPDGRHHVLNRGELLSDMPGECANIGADGV